MILHYLHHPLTGTHIRILTELKHGFDWGCVTWVMSKMKSDSE